jgi:hypothetical protein
VIQIGDGRIEVLINGRPKNRDRCIRIPQAGSICGGDQFLAYNVPQLLQGIGLHKRHLAGVHRVYFGLVAIEKNDIQSTIGEYDAKGQTYMAAPPYNDNLLKRLHEPLIASFWTKH